MYLISLCNVAQELYYILMIVQLFLLLTLLKTSFPFLYTFTIVIVKNKVLKS